MLNLEFNRNNLNTLNMQLNIVDNNLANDNLTIYMDDL